MNETIEIKNNVGIINKRRRMRYLSIPSLHNPKGR
jgi:hypothetical protein